MIIEEEKLLNDLTIALVAHTGNTNGRVLCYHMADLYVPFEWAFMLSIVALTSAPVWLTFAVPILFICHLFVTSNLCHNVTLMSMVIHLSFPLNDSNIRLYRFTYFCRFEVLLCMSSRSSSFTPPYTRACNLNVAKGPFVRHKVCNVSLIQIGFGSGSHVIILLNHLATQL